MKIKNDILICSCNSIQHQIVFRILDDENFDREVFVQIYLTTYRGFWKRLWTGIKYAFGYKSKYGHWDEFFLNDTHIEKLEEVVKYLKGNKENDLDNK